MSDADFLPYCRPQILKQDIDAVVRVLESRWITTGAVCAELEAKIRDVTGARFAVAVSSGTAALHLALHALGIGPGDEVITPSMTWVSTANSIKLLGATPVFVDVDRHHLMTDAELIERAVTARTRAVIPVHFAGAPLHMDAIRRLCRSRGIAVIEDAAHVLGATQSGTPVGSVGNAFFSFQATKNVTGAEGGVFVTDDERLATRIRSLRFHGLGADAFDRDQLGRKPQVEVLEPGFKFNLPDLCAALALSQLGRLDAIIDSRTALAARYDEAFANDPHILPLSRPDLAHRHAWHLYVVRLADTVAMSRDAFVDQLRVRGIGAGIHFKAVHTHRYYRELPEGRVKLDNTLWNSERVLSLPLFPEMTADDVARVCDAVKGIAAG
jgi:UDP-4-amino-4-deoxy-L-arabinose-oxoglutarate aminotransferase